MSFIGKVFILDDYFNDKNRNNVEYDNIEIVKDIVYDSLDGEDFAGDLYLNTKVKAPMPVVIYIHGGGWITGDKKFRRGFSKTLANSGIAVFNINYALSPRHKYPTCVINAFHALQWICDNADKYNLDIDNIFMSGESAGAHIAAMCGSTINNTEFKNKFGIKNSFTDIKGLLLYCGVYNIETMLKKPFAASTFRDISGRDIKEIREYEYYKELSPLNYVDENFPSTFLVSSKHDVFCYGQDKELIEKMQAYKVKFNWFYAKTFFNSVHCFQLSLKTNNSKKCIENSIKFVKNLACGEKLE